MLTPATADDLPGAVALINLSYRGDAALQGWANENDYVSGERMTLAELQRSLEVDPDARLLLCWAESPGALLGCVWLRPCGDNVWYLGVLAVRPELQNCRIGRTILEAAEAIARGQGGRMMRMTVVHLRDTLVAWYQRRGYVPTGETEPFPQPDRALRDLHLVVLEKRL